MSDFLKANSDKVLLTALLVYLSLYALHTAHHTSDVDLASWSTKTSDLITGALLTLITGGRLMQRRVDTEGGTEAAPTSKSTTVTTVSTDQKAPTPVATEKVIAPEPKKENP